MRVQVRLSRQSCRREAAADTQLDQTSTRSLQCVQHKPEQSHKQRSSKLDLAFSTLKLPKKCFSSIPIMRNSYRWAVDLCLLVQFVAFLVLHSMYLRNNVTINWGRGCVKCAFRFYKTWRYHVRNSSKLTNVQEGNCLDLMGSCAMVHRHVIEEHIQTQEGNMFVFMDTAYKWYIVYCCR